MIHLCKPQTGCTCSLVRRTPRPTCPTHGRPGQPRCDCGRYVQPTQSASMRRFVCYFYRTSWAHLSLGAHVCFKSPNVEVHVPFGFFRLGWVKTIMGETRENIQRRVFGYDGAA